MEEKRGKMSRSVWRKWSWWNTYRLMRWQIAHFCLQITSCQSMEAWLCWSDSLLPSKTTIVWSVASQESHENCCYQMSDFKAKMHQIRGEAKGRKGEGKGREGNFCPPPPLWNPKYATASKYIFTAVMHKEPWICMTLKQTNVMYSVLQKRNSSKVRATDFIISPDGRAYKNINDTKYNHLKIKHTHTHTRAHAHTHTHTHTVYV